MRIELETKNGFGMCALIIIRPNHPGTGQAGLTMEIRDGKQCMVLEITKEMLGVFALLNKGDAQ